ncbi:uncharacterized protein MYCFIDRAFT_177609 [Pseudocercospora fijiensis CIRAD86]|uniref:Uncharacterized protein n=1 Tax=Pseudocercospora fijiensis (strain CIRAD86) TaxID=383855 RepID=M3AT70_PSEFD|nr:uncharacterized protein MYCFIDRAFT_177609 [Pseudocercospora fijiensis CIRAD86]EME80677.1 hypothetical protein MYCFIDRAFT_177609 [Pseudocercospora fijiensis CIRAD86]
MKVKNNSHDDGTASLCFAINYYGTTLTYSLNRFIHMRYHLRTGSVRFKPSLRLLGYSIPTSALRDRPPDSKNKTYLPQHLTS